MSAPLFGRAISICHCAVAFHLAQAISNATSPAWSTQAESLSGQTNRSLPTVSQILWLAALDRPSPDCCPQMRATFLQPVVRRLVSRKSATQCLRLFRPRDAEALKRLDQLWCGVLHTLKDDQAPAGCNDAVVQDFELIASRETYARANRGSPPEAQVCGW